MDRKQYDELRDPRKIMEWLTPYIGHEHLMDIKEAPSLEKYLAVAPDQYVMAAMLQSMLMRAAEQREFGEYGAKEEEKIKPWGKLTEEEKISEAPIRKAYMDGCRRGRDLALIEMANRITMAAREQLDRYRLENPVFDPEEIISDSPLDEEDE